MPSARSSDRSTCFTRRTAVNEKNTRPEEGQDRTDPSIDTTTPATEPDLLAEVEASDNAVIAALPNVERAAFKRELTSALSRATWGPPT